MIRRSLLTILLLLAGWAAWGQESESVAIAKSLDLFLFPAEDQDQATQDEDELACYKWAMEQTDYDPINPPQIQAEQVDQSADGTAVRSAARGAAAGDQQQQQQNNQAAAAQEKELLDRFKKAFSVCMEGKGYTVK